MQFQPSAFSDMPPAPPQARAPVSTPMMLGVAAVGASILLVVPLVAVPFALKSVVPDWSYGRRVGAGIGIGLALGAAGGLARALSGKS